MKYAIDTLLIEYCRLLLANRKLDVIIGCGPDDVSVFAYKENAERIKAIEWAIKTLNECTCNNTWKL